MNGSNFSLGGDGKVVEGSLERQGQAQLNEKKRKIWGRISILRSQNTKIALISVCLKMGKLLRAR